MQGTLHISVVPYCSPRDGVNFFGIKVPAKRQRKRKLARHTKWEFTGKQTRNSEVKRVEPILESFGPCAKFHRCKNVGLLGDGLCVECWDGSRRKVKGEDEIDGTEPGQV